MYRFCERCERDTKDGNLWCQDPDCPAEKGYPLLRYGDYLGDLKVTKLVRVWRTAAIYEAEREQDQVLLKVAHPGDDHAERLRRETLAFESFSPIRPGMGALVRSFLPRSRPRYPLPLPPYPSRSKQPYGEITFRGEARVFSVFEYAQGKILSDLLLETPQIWHTQAAWIVIALAEALRPLASRNKCHLSLTPDTILIDTDKEGNLRPLLLDLGFILDSGNSNGYSNWLPLCEPSYTAPELLSDAHPETHTPAADVYSLGLIYFEMLAGRPGFENKLRRDGQLREDILLIRKPLSVGRPELQQSGVAQILEHAVAPSGRYTNVNEFSKALKKVYSAPPAEPKKIPRRLYILISVTALILITVGIFTIVTLLQVLSGTP
jgi:serine/threonine protein kinase